MKNLLVQWFGKTEICSSGEKRLDLPILHLESFLSFNYLILMYFCICSYVDWWYSNSIAASHFNVSQFYCDTLKAIESN